MRKGHAPIWWMLAIWVATCPIFSTLALAALSPSNHHLSVSWHHGCPALLLKHEAVEHAEHVSEHRHQLADRLVLAFSQGDDGGHEDHMVLLGGTERASRPSDPPPPDPDALAARVSAVDVTWRETVFRVSQHPGPAPPPPRRNTPLQI